MAYHLSQKSSRDFSALCLLKNITLKRQSKCYHTLFLLFCVTIGLCLRFHNLTLKPFWADEFSTAIFGLGQSYKTVALNQFVTIEELLAPLSWNPLASFRHTISALFQESNHPPLYFVLTHIWVDFWQRFGLFGSHEPMRPLVFIWVMRSLSALCGTLAIPVIYGVAWWLWHSPRVAQFAAILMALSPFGIYLSQEARHYSLPIIWITGSVACLVVTIRQVQDDRPIPLWLGITWVSLNGLGLATHYFFILTLLAQGIVILGWMAYYYRYQILNTSLRYKQTLLWRSSGNNWRLVVIALVTALTGVTWIPLLVSMGHNNELMRWIQAPVNSPTDWSVPLVNTLASIGSMVYLMPIQDVNHTVVIFSAITLTLMVGATLWLMNQAIWHSKHSPLSCSSFSDSEALPVVILAAIGLSAIMLMATITYGFGLNISQVFRYHFVYFPIVILLVAWGFAQTWARFPGVIMTILVITCFGALTVSNNLGYQKLHRPDKVVQMMGVQSQYPLAIAISHQSHGQTGRMMALALAMKSLSLESLFHTPQFFLDHQPCDRPGAQNCNTPSVALKAALATLGQPVDLWLINYVGKTDLAQQQCHYQATKRVDGYKVQHYTCFVEQ